MATAAEYWKCKELLWEAYQNSEMPSTERRLTGVIGTIMQQRKVEEPTTAEFEKGAITTHTF